MNLVVLVLLLFLVSAVSSFTQQGVIEVVSNTKDYIVDQLEWERKSVNISKIDTRDVQIGDGYVYEVHVEVGGSTIPITFADEVSEWSSIEIPPEGIVLSDELALPPFQLAGPVELRLVDAKNIRLAVPHDVDAGALDRVLLAEGATVTITGAREISISKPIRLPLPLVDGKTQGKEADSLIHISEQLKDAAKSYDKPVISFRVVQPASLIASAPPALPLERLKVKKTSQGAVEITKHSSAPLQKREAITNKEWLWPLPSLKSSDAKLVTIQQTLKVLLGPLAKKKGSITVLKARAYQARFLKVEFELVRKIDDTMWPWWPQWQTKPTLQRKQFELLVTVDGDKLIPHSVAPLYPYISEPTEFGWSGVDVIRNVSLAKFSPLFLVSSPLTL